MRRKFWLPIIGLVFAAVAAMPVAQATEKTYFCFGHRATIVGTPGSDLIYGTTGADVIHGRGSSDLIHGRNGNDIICGGRGGDQHAIRPENHDGHYGLIGGNGNDIVRGGAGDDSIQGGDPLQNPYYGRPEPDPSETDVLYGGGGDDQMLDGGQLQGTGTTFPAHRIRAMTPCTAVPVMTSFIPAGASTI
ncbi:MAG TPA: calcium-binding protein [Actinomycetota bacterium]|nr:calcium-binding protein [Actinomycetota bacterium]